MNRMKTLCLWDLSVGASVVDPLKMLTEIDLYAPTYHNLLGQIEEADVYLASPFVGMDSQVLDRASRLKVVGFPGMTPKFIDVNELTKRGIKFVSIADQPDVLNSITAPAEHAWALLLASVRKIPIAMNGVMGGLWGTDRFMGTQLQGRRLGLIGMDRTAAMIANYAQAFGMPVLAHDPIGESSMPRNVRSADLFTLLQNSDIVSLHMPVTAETQGFIDASKIQLMQDGVVIVNVSHADLIDEFDLAKAVSENKIGAVAVDAVRGEWNDIRDSVLVQLATRRENVVITPGLADQTYESQALIYQFICERVAAEIQRRP